MTQSKLRVPNKRISTRTSEYSSIHSWVKRNIDDPKVCQACHSNDKKLTWANRSGQYLKEKSDWLRLCYQCHKRYDVKLPTHCPKGHKYDEDNSYRLTSNGRNQKRCIICNREGAKIGMRKFRALQRYKGEGNS